MLTLSCLLLAACAPAPVLIHVPLHSRSALYVTELELVVQQLTEANEQLVLRAAKVSEAELQEIQQEAAGRLAAAERKVSIKPLELCEAAGGGAVDDPSGPIGASVGLSSSKWEARAFMQGGFLSSKACPHRRCCCL